jgi:hypothetical protein
MSTPAPSSGPTISITGGKLSEILIILQDALNVLAVVPVTAMPAGLASVILGIVTAAVTRIQSQTGRPLDLTNIPTEAPLP